MARFLDEIGVSLLWDKIKARFTPKTTTILLSANKWTSRISNQSPYMQILNIDGVTATSKIDLQPTVEILDYLRKEEISLVAENDEGIVTIYAVGYKPTIDINLQIQITEVIQK